MQVKFPYLYSISVKLGNRRTVEHFVHLDWETLSIPEISSDTAPLVARAQVSGIEQKALGNENLELKSIDYRATPGGLVSAFSTRYTANVYGDLAVDVPELTASNILDTIREWETSVKQRNHYHGNLQLYSAIKSVNGSFKEKGSLQIRKLEGDTREKERVALRKAMQGAVFIDGVLYTKSTGPVWFVDQYFMYGRARQEGNFDAAVECRLVQDVDKVNVADRYRCFLAEDRDLAKACVHNIFKTRDSRGQHNNYGFADAGVFELFNAELWQRWQTENHSVDAVETANSVLSEMSKTLLQQSNVNLENFMGLKKTVLSAGTAMGNENGKALCRDVIEGIDAWIEETRLEAEILDVQAPDSRMFLQAKEKLLYLEEIMQKEQGNLIQKAEQLVADSSGIEIGEDEVVITDYDLDDLLGDIPSL